MKLEKCTSCGANLSNIQKGDKVVCLYCDTVYTSNSRESQAIQQTINQVATQSVPYRPRISLFITLFLLCFGLFPAIIYINVIKNQQKAWDIEYANSVKNN